MTRTPPVFNCVDLFVSTPPTPTADGDTWVVGPSATDAWAGKENYVADWAEVLNDWRFFLEDGCTASSSVTHTTYRWNAFLSKWVRVYPLSIAQWVKNGDQTVTGSFVDIEGFTTVVADHGTLGGFTIDSDNGQITYSADPSSGRQTNEIMDRARIVAHVRLKVTASGTPPNNVEVQLARGGTLIPGTLRVVYMNTTALNHDKTVDFDEIVLAIESGTDFSVQVKQTAGDGTVIVEADGTSMYMEELAGYTFTE